MNKTKKNTRGITLIALVITIVVLLILAGITIAALSGDNGILAMSKEAKEKTKLAQKEEEKTLSNMENILGIYNFKNINIADTNPTEVVPENSIIIEADANKGIVIKDKNNNEWVWIEVPKTTVFTDLTIDTTNTLTEQNYTDIKNKLITYAGIYRNGSVFQNYNNWTDEWYEGCGMTSDEYTIAYQKMLKSIYTYGGFWIGRYEAGIEGSIEDISKARTTHTDVTIGTSSRAISQKDAIPYNYVYCSEAQALAKEMTPDSNYTSSLMFGMQWNLVCKFLETKSNLITEDINSNSSDWGNYRDTKIENILSGKYAVYDGSTLGVWTKLSAPYTKQDSGNDYRTLLSTGISEYTNKMNIYDFAGNEWEWTLEKTSLSNGPCVSRGGYYGNTGFAYPASYCGIGELTRSDALISFRGTFYK